MSKNKIQVLTDSTMLENTLGIFKRSNKHKVVFKKPTKKQIESGEVAVDHARYSLTQLNKVMGETGMFIIDPDTASIEEVAEMARMANARKFIPLYVGKDCKKYDAETEEPYLDFNTLSFGVFTGANPDRSTSDFVFAFLSNNTDQADIEDELETYRPKVMGGNTIDSLNDLFGVTAGADYSIVYTCDLTKNPKFIAPEVNKIE